MSSDYYFSLMCQYANSKRGVQDKKSSYESYIKKLRLLHAGLWSVHSNFKDAEKAFLDGGYNDSGESLDHGKLKKNYNLLESTINSLDDVIDKVDDEINAMVVKINEYTSLYETAKDNYYDALRRESM